MPAHHIKNKAAYNNDHPYSKGCFRLGLPIHAQSVFVNMHKVGSSFCHHPCAFYVVDILEHNQQHILHNTKQSHHGIGRPMLANGP